MATIDDSWLSLAELVAYSGLSLRTLERHRHNADNPLPHYKVGPRILVKRSEFDEWVRLGATPSRPRYTFDAKVSDAVASLRRR
jgi:excisionase family DNA binding protein